MEQTKQQEKPANAVDPEKDKGGVWVQLGDKSYKVPPLNFKSIRALMGKLNTISAMQKNSMPTDDQIQVVSELMQAALARNYPNLSLDDIEDGLDMGNFGNALAAVMGTSGLVKQGTPGSGEAGATAPQS